MLKCAGYVFWNVSSSSLFPLIPLKGALLPLIPVKGALFLTNLKQILKQQQKG